MLGARVGSFSLYLKEEDCLVITATHGYPKSLVEHLRIRPGDGIIGQAFVRARPTLGRPAALRRPRLRYRTDSYLALPLLVRGSTLAVLTFSDRVDGQPFDQTDLRAARVLGAAASLALAHERVSANLDDLTKAATVDPVTELFNRRHFEARVQAEVQRSRRQILDLALLMVDIDDFKRVNDTLGHLEGDRVLRDVADLLRSGVRVFDVCARYGGEEFAIVMPGASEQVAVQVAERIRSQVQERLKSDPVPITISVGVGTLQPGESAEDLISGADRALIAAKKAGKNTVRSAHATHRPA
jgi:diguanylate cyclase (GGDEF)-like protein